MAASAGAIKAGKAYVELMLNDKLSRGLKGAEKKLKSFGAGVRNVGARLMGVGTAALAGFGAATAHFVSFGDQLDKMGRRTGVGTEALSEFAFAARRSGASLGDVETGLRRMQRSIYDAGRGLSTQTDALRDLGLKYEDLAGLSPEEQFQRVADALSSVEDATTRAALAQALLGRSGTKLLPMLEDLAGLREEARRLGLGISKEDTDAAMRLADAMGDVWDTVKRGLFAVGAAIAPILTPLAQRLSEIIARAGGWIDANREWVRWAAKVAAITAAVGAALVVVGTGIVALGAVFGGLASIAGIVGTALSVILGVLGAILSPIGLVIAAVAVLGAYFLHASGAMGKAMAWLKTKFAALADFAGKSFQGIKDALAAGDFGLAARILWLSLKLAWQKGVSYLKTIWADFKGWFLKVAADAFYGVQALWVQLASHVKRVWHETLGTVKTVFAAFSGVAQLKLMKGRHKREAAEITARFERGELTKEEYEAEKQAFMERVRRERQAVIDATDAQLAGIDKEEKARVQAVEAERDEALAGIGRKHAEALDAIESERDAAVAATKGELDEARRAWEEALGEAEEKREALGAEEGPEGPGAIEKPGDFLSQVKTDLAGLGDRVARAAEKTFSVRGTFNAAAIRALAGGTAADRTAKATEETAKNTKRLVDEATMGEGLVFD